ncbi:MAG: Rieske (2Fe-2S) protein [Nitrososphaeraceae archaeon]|jgi:nitrite reductase/ring-hydroxylating ferredoxin subunit
MLSKTDNHNYIYVANTREIEAAGGRLSVTVKKYTVAIFIYDSKVYAVDNRCPHMGFPLNQGTVKDGILTCHWHHARFDLMNGGTFDQWAGDVTSFPVEIRNENEIWIDVSAAVVDITDSHHHNQTLLLNGLKRNIPLLIAKTIIASLGILRNKEDSDKKVTNGMLDAFSVGLDFGSHYKQSGWGQGLTIHTCMMNIVPFIGIEDMPYALYHGLSAVAQDCASMPPRFKIFPLPEPWPDLSTLKSWFRQFIESRDAQAAERCIVTAVRLGVDNRDIADMLFAAATDHRYLDVGHVLDFTNKALEALDSVGWDNNNNKDLVESVLSSLVSGYANAERMEESNSWRYPIDLIDILEKAFKKLPAVLENGRAEQSEKKRWNQRNELLTVLLGDDPQLIVNSLLKALSQGAREEELAGIVAYTAALRIAQFHTRNEFSDWDTSLHTFTYTNAVHQGLRRIATHELLRGMFDGAMRVYLNRFLNIPLVPLPEPKKMENISNETTFKEPEMLLKELLSLLDKQQQVNQAGQLVVDYLYNNGKPDRLLAAIGKALLREDRSFHSIQMIEAAFRQYSLLSANDYENNGNSTTGVHILVAAARYLAAHSPTMRSQGHTYQTANQLYHGEHLFEG